jgi:hypothetical protein
MNEYYIYIHFNASTRAVFYVGMGSQKEYKRAFAKLERSVKWKEYVRLNPNYEVEIISEGLAKEHAIYLETEFIKTYRRICDGGTLVNESFGIGHRGLKPSKECKDKIIASCRKVRKQDMKSVICLNTGIVYESTKQAAKALKVSAGNISDICKGKHGRTQTKGLKFKYN